MSDATHYVSGERLIRQFTYPHIPKQSSQVAAAAAAAAPVAPAGEAKEEDPSSEEEEEDGPCDMHADGAVRTPRTHFLLHLWRVLLPPAAEMANQQTFRGR